MTASRPTLDRMPNETEPIEGWEISPQRVKAMLDAGEPLVLLDCREPDEVATASIDGAVVMPLSEMRARLTEVQAYADDKVVVFCHAGVRSMQVTGFLREQGFEDVTSMAGGIDAWSVQVDPSVPRY